MAHWTDKHTKKDIVAHYEAEIARLTAEVDRTNDVLESQAHVIRDLRGKLDKALRRPT